jgi:hypothetical protein
VAPFDEEDSREGVWDAGLIVDVSTTKEGPMSIAQAEEFVGVIKQETGRLPILYSG